MLLTCSYSYWTRLSTLIELYCTTTYGKNQLIDRGEHTEDTVWDDILVPIIITKRLRLRALILAWWTQLSRSMWSFPAFLHIYIYIYIMILTKIDKNNRHESKYDLNVRKEADEVNIRSSTSWVDKKGSSLI